MEEGEFVTWENSAMVPDMKAIAFDVPAGSPAASNCYLEICRYKIITAPGF